MRISLQMYRQIKPALITLRLLYDSMTVPVWVLTCTLIGHILKPIEVHALCEQISTTKF